MADSDAEVFINLVSQSEKWKNNGLQLFDEYPKLTFPATLKASTGKKAKLCLFEEINSELYEKAAKMVAFKTNSERLPAWIRSAWLYFYDHLGEMDSYNINWSHDPPTWTKEGITQLKSISVHVYAAGEAEAEFDNPLLYHMTIFITTGLIEIQGNQYEQFQTTVFPILHSCVKKMMNEKQFQIKSTSGVSQSDDESFINMTDLASQPLQTVCSLPSDNHLNKSFDKTLIDSFIEDEIERISDPKIPENVAADNGSVASVEPLFEDSLTDLKTPWVIHSDKTDAMKAKSSDGTYVETMSDPKPTSETTSCDPIFFQKFEENISEALGKMKKSQKQFIQSNVVAIISSQSEILERHGKLLDSICSKIDNVQKSSTCSPLRSGHETINKKLENEVSKLKLRIHTLESEKSDYEYNTQKLKSDYGIKVAILESENEFLQQNVDKLKRQISCAMKDISQDEKVLLDKLNKKNDEILHLEDINSSLRKKLSEAEVLFTNVSCNHDSFETVSHKARNADKTNSVEDTIQKQPAKVNSPPIVIDKEKEVLLVGTSIVKNIDPKILSKDYDITKSSAYSLEETAKVIETSKADPDVVVLHSLTNNLKTEEPNSCVEKLNNIIDTTILKWPTTHVMVSMETPRADDADINNRVLVANSLIRSTFYKKSNVSIIDNSNLAVQGQPILRFLNQSDKVHLSRQGTSMLANNIRSSLDARFGLRGNDRGSKAQPPGGRGIQHPGNRGRRRPGSPGGYFPPWFRYGSPPKGYYQNFSPF